MKKVHQQKNKFKSSGPKAPQIISNPPSKPNVRNHTNINQNNLRKDSNKLITNSPKRPPIQLIEKPKNNSGNSTSKPINKPSSETNQKFQNTNTLSKKEPKPKTPQLVGAPIRREDTKNPVQQNTFKNKQVNAYRSNPSNKLSSIPATQRTNAVLSATTSL